MTAPILGWQPTHRTPAAGLASWSAPDVSAPAAAALDANLDVQVVQQHGDWAKVRCSNGWETWVDGRQLLDATAPAVTKGPATASQPRWLVVGVVALVAVAVAVGIVVTRKPASDQAATAAGSTTTITTTHAPHVNPISLDVPNGWAKSDDGMVAAEQSTDLTADIPKGPRVRAHLNQKSNPIDTDFANASASPPEIAAEPEPTEIDGQAAIGITLVESDRGNKIVRRYLTLDTPQHDAILFILEAPADQWDAKISTLKDVPGLK